MLTPEAIDQLAELDGKDAWVLSVYLDLDASTQVRRAYRIVFEDAVRDLRILQGAAALPQFSDEVARVQTFLEREPPRGKGLVVFSCAPAGLWRAEFLAVRVPNHVVFEPKPDLAPLLRVVDEYERYGVALVDKRRARLFTVFLGEIEESDELRDRDAIGRHDQGGLSQAKYQRHHEWHVYRHLKRVAERLADLHRRRRFDRLILAGPEEATSELHRVLPRPLARHVAAVVPATLDAGLQDILERTLSVERMVERGAEERLVQQLLELAGPAGRSVLGVRPTLAALWADLVQTLVVAQSARGEGSDCPNCERLEPGRIEQCPTCGSTMRRVHDVFHRAMHRVVERSGRAEVVVGAAERRLTERGGGLGALLRYPSPVPQAMHEAATHDGRARSEQESGDQQRQKEAFMANEQSRRQGERQSTAMERSEGGERGLATRQYQDPFSLFDSLFERMQRDFFGTSLLNALVPTRGNGGEGGEFVRVPRVQMRDTGEALELTAEMPGIDPKNVAIEIEDNVLTIRGEQRLEEKRDDARMERQISFYRQISLPDGIDTEQAQASYKNGVLTLRFARTRPQSSARHIPITTEQQSQQRAA